MSEFLQNDPHKQALLKDIIRRLHEGEESDSVKRDFAKLIRNVSPEEIVAMEQALIQEGLPVSEVQRLCDVHVDVFKSAMTREGGRAGKIAGHPVHTFVQENKTARKLLKAMKKTAKPLAKGSVSQTAVEQLGRELDHFAEIEKHYARKENQLFPYLERTGFTGPSTVMWGKHDDIRRQIKEVRRLYTERQWRNFSAALKALSGMIKNMAFMEERILFPNALKRLSDQDWVAIRRGEAEIGYAWVTPGNLWDANIVGAGAASAARETTPSTSTTPAAGAAAPPTSAASTADAYAPASGSAVADVPLDTGALSPERINLMLKNLPVDITYVDENDRVLYYSAGSHRVFPRSPAIIGRTVQNCHPHKSVDVVNRIVESFRNKEKDVAEFWIGAGDRFVHIRYYPLYNNQGVYRGVIEVSQDVTEIRALEGERRLLDW